MFSNALPSLAIFQTLGISNQVKEKIHCERGSPDKIILDLSVVLICSGTKAIEFSKLIDEIYTLEHLFVAFLHT